MQQAWCGLSTTPCANGASLQLRHRLGDEFHGAARAGQTQGQATYRGRPLIPPAPALVSYAPPKKHAERFEIFS